MKYTIDIPENATNGDIMQALFPVKEIIGRLDPAKWLDVLIDGNRYSQFDKTWWNEVWNKGDNMTEEQLKQLTDFAATKRTKDLLKIREELERLALDQENEDVRAGVYMALDVVNKRLSDIDTLDSIYARFEPIKTSEDYRKKMSEWRDSVELPDGSIMPWGVI